ncbi:unnamed protein product [Colias eurytheme]|nr:unnamed protein product [Colias eurytheme]
MVGLFVVIAVIRLGTRTSQPPDGVARCHKSREAVTSHAQQRSTRISTAFNKSQATPELAHGTTRTKVDQQVTGSPHGPNT